MRVEKVVFLIHPLIYENLEKTNPQTIREGNYQIYREREKLCEQGWRKALDTLAADTIFIQLYGGKSILEYARQKLGPQRVVAPAAEYDKDKPIAVYHDRLAESIRQIMKANKVEMDPATVRWELWGESFEGCVHSYGTGIVTSLGVKHPPVINLDMTVPDARFLCVAKLVETFPIDGTDIRAYVFDGPLGHPIAALMPGFRAADDAPDRHVALELDKARVQVVNKTGITLFSRKGGRGSPGPDRDHGGIVPTEKGLMIRPTADWYLLTPSLTTDALLGVLRNAKVVVKEASTDERP